MKNTHPQQSEYLDFAKHLARDAGKIIKDNFTPGISKDIKQDGSIVTKADTDVNALVLDSVLGSYPDHSVLAEEESRIQKDSEYVWVCDPIDGTILFSHSVPTCMFSLALVKNGTPVVAVTYDPFLDRLFSAEKDHGAHINDKQMHVNSNALSCHAIIGAGLNSKALYNIDGVIQFLNEKYNLVCMDLESIVYMGSLVALGEFEGALFSSKGAHDVAAIKLIVEEAGGRVTDLSGSSQRYDRQVKGAVFSNGVVHDELVEIVKKKLIV